MPPLVLASTSPYRRELLARLGIPFEVEGPGVDETALAGEKPEAQVVRLARAKAAAVASRRPGAVVVGSDQLAQADGLGTLGKPGDAARARAQLAALSGRKALFLTALAVARADGQVETELVPTEVHFRALGAAEIAAYVERERPFDCAGSFKSEGLGIALFERIASDDPTALVGLPLIALARRLRALGFAIP